MADIKSCGFLIYRNDPNPSFLLMRHPDRWDLPKGHVDHGETELECALRELIEETGIDAGDIEIDRDFRFHHEYVVKSKKYRNQPKRKQLIIYLAQLVRPVDIVVTEHDGYEWHDWQPPHQIQFKTIDPLLAHLQQHWEQ